MTKATPLAAAIRRKEWERAALLLLIGLLEAARNAPSGTIDDVLAMLSLEEDWAATDDGRRTTDDRRRTAADRQQIEMRPARRAHHRGHRGNDARRGGHDGE